MTFRLHICLFVALMTLAGPAGTDAQECETGRIGTVFVDNHSVFDTTEMEEDARFRWAYDLANTLHVDTKASFLRQELLFSEGECLDPFLLEESARIIRNYPFIARADVFGIRQPDGRYNVVVDTRDEWTTKLNVGVGIEDGLQLESVELTEENLAGYGVLSSVFFREARERRDLGFEIEAPRLFSTRIDTHLSAGTTRAGTFLSQGFVYPFVGEVGRTAARQTFSSRESLFPYVLDDGGAYRRVLLPYDAEILEVSAAWRLGRPGNLTVFGVGFLREAMTFDGFPEDLELAPEGTYSMTEPARPEDVEAVSSQVYPTTILRLNLLLGQRNIRFVQHEGLDALHGVQDVELGTELALTVGRAIGDIGSGSTDAPDDLYLRFYGFGGWDPADWILSAAANLEARPVFADESPQTYIRDILGEVDLYAYRTGVIGEAHTLFGRISAAGGWSVRRPFQLTLGGSDGVRGYTGEDFPGGRRVVATLEDRLGVNWPAPELFDLGFTFFADAGRIWAGDVPFGRTTSWQASVGTGLRLAFPAGSRGVIRADLAFPITGPRSASSPVFRLSLQEVLGLLPGVDDSQILRSRRPAVGTDLLTDIAR